jgi:hypothetical protein
VAEILVCWGLIIGNLGQTDKQAPQAVASQSPIGGDFGKIIFLKVSYDPIHNYLRLNFYYLTLQNAPTDIYAKSAEFAFGNSLF